VPLQLVVIGGSLGGLRALETVLQELPADFFVPIAVVLHRRSGSDGTLRSILQRYTRLRVREPNDKESIEVGRLYIAPPDYHLLVEPGFFALSTEGPVSFARPSIDVLLESAADSYGPALAAVILTGANHDGATGAARVKEQGGRLVVQDPESAECGVMPRAAISAAAPDQVLPLAGISTYLAQLAGSETNHG
jgi:two-component system, chemotaxis family, protein-glutamate methylesterase/glutaminase